jgi:hypothetical protein
MALEGLRATHQKNFPALFSKPIICTMNTAQSDNVGWSASSLNTRQQRAMMGGRVREHQTGLLQVGTWPRCDSPSTPHRRIAPPAAGCTAAPAAAKQDGVSTCMAPEAAEWHRRRHVFHGQMESRRAGWWNTHDDTLRQSEWQLVVPAEHASGQVKQGLADPGA